MFRLLGQLLGGDSTEVAVTKAPGGTFLEIRRPRSGGAAAPSPPASQDSQRKLAEAENRAAQFQKERDAAFAALAELKKRYQALESGRQAPTGPPKQPQPARPPSTQSPGGNGPQPAKPAAPATAPAAPSGAKAASGPTTGPAPSPEVERVVSVLTAPRSSAPKRVLSTEEEARRLKEELATFGGEKDRKENAPAGGAGTGKPR